jgi:peptidoglycan/xylan/chitin deacetylase (PgdA/CDA1 family)
MIPSAAPAIAWILGSIASIPLCAGSFACLIWGHPARRPSGHPPVLVFHTVTDAPRAGYSHLSVSRFAAFIENLGRQGYAATTIRGFSADAALHSKCILTFDDGFSGTADSVLPILDRFGFKAVFFPVAGFLGRQSTWDVFAAQPHMTARQVRAMAAAGHEIGSHGMTHADLTMLPNADLRGELADSKKVLEDIIGMPVTSLSFPFGGWNRRVWQTAREIGYSRATIYRGLHDGSRDLFPAIGVYAFDGPDDLLGKITGKAGGNARARSRIMPHFAKGSPLWMFRSNYRL